MTMFDVSTVTLAVLVLLIALALGATVAWMIYAIRVVRLPAATKLVDVEERFAIAEEALQRKEQDLRDIDQKISDRDRLAGEAGALREQIDDLNAQLANLEPAREDIAATLQEAAEAASNLAAAKQELKDAEARLEEVNRELDPERVNRLRQQQQEAERELDHIRNELAPLRAEADVARRAITEVQQNMAHAEAVKLEAKRLKDECDRLSGEAVELQDQLKQARDELGPLQVEREDAKRQRNVAKDEHGALSAELQKNVSYVEALKLEAKRVNDECDQLSRKGVELQDQLKHARDELSPLQVERADAVRQRDVAKAEHRALNAEVQQLETRIVSLRDDLKEALAQIQPGAQGQPPIGPLTEAQRKVLLSDLLAWPACLAAPTSLREAAMTEADALQVVRNYLQQSGLQFSGRVQRAFHTALKINDTAQITVLAGVSGTGKSLLPRSYAEAMGIHFMQVAVEPRWDSPQDLLGFYNYVEGKYRATELARLMASMDPWQSFGKDVPNSRDHLAMVLLDEMNLARVEYYFSEFLSRLEVRPQWRNNLQREACKYALIPVDIRGLENPTSLFPGHNILFVGTMNDDESTQSLSDKVLDRGNVMQFPAPTRFPAPVQNAAPAAAEALRFDRWRGWIRAAKDLQGADATRVGHVITDLAAIMDGFGRPFGHRMNQSIRHYIANYPTEGTGGTVAQALADQIEFRILPKLRGLEIGNHGTQFDALEKLIRDTLGDSDLANRTQQLREVQEQGAGQFVWRGLERE